MNRRADPSSDELIAELGLTPHPEGGFYREIYRSTSTCETARGTRAHATAIYFLLRRGDISAFHRIRSDEVWHFHAGGPLRVVCLDARGRTDLRLGLDLAHGEAPQGVVPAGSWFGAFTEADFTLVGCTVAPGFDFADFEMGSRAALEAEFPAHAAIVRQLTSH